MAGSPKDLAECLRSYAGDGTVEWVLEPMQSRVLSESAQLIDEMAVLCADTWHLLYDWLFKAGEVPYKKINAVYKKMLELGIEVN